MDDALTLIAKLGVLYERLSRSDQKEPLRNVVERVIVNPEGKIACVDLLPPFAYLQDVSDKVSDGEKTSENTTLNETSDSVVACSRQVLDCGHNRTQLEPILSRNTLEFTQSISFPQQEKLRRLSLQN